MTGVENEEVDAAIASWLPISTFFHSMTFA